MIKFTMLKKWQKWSNNYIQTTYTSSYHEENMQSFKTSLQNCKRSQKVPTVYILRVKND